MNVRWKQKGQEGQEGQKSLFAFFALLALFASPSLLPMPDQKVIRESSIYDRTDYISSMEIDDDGNAQWLS
jgi:hypothetical protein